MRAKHLPFTSARIIAGLKRMSAEGAGADRAFSMGLRWIFVFLSMSLAGVPATGQAGVPQACPRTSFLTVQNTPFWSAPAPVLAFFYQSPIARAKRLAITPNPRRGGKEEPVIVYVVYRGSGNGKPPPLRDILANSSRLFKSFGGRPALNACLASPL